MRPFEVAGTILHVLSLGIVTGGYVAAAWSPFLLLGRVRPLFDVGPTDDWWVNYLIVASAVGVVHVVVFIGGSLLFGASLAPVEVLFYSGIGVALAGMTVAGVVVPALGYDWPDSQEWFATALSLLGGAIWYAAITIIPPFVLWTMYLART